MVERSHASANSKSNDAQPSFKKSRITSGSNMVARVRTALSGQQTRKPRVAVLSLLAEFASFVGVPGRRNNCEGNAYRRSLCPEDGQCRACWRNSGCLDCKLDSNSFSVESVNERISKEPTKKNVAMCIATPGFFFVLVYCALSLAPVVFSRSLALSYDVFTTPPTHRRGGGASCFSLSSVDTAIGAAAGGGAAASDGVTDGTMVARSTKKTLRASY